HICGLAPAAGPSASFFAWSFGPAPQIGFVPPFASATTAGAFSAGPLRPGRENRFVHQLAFEQPPNASPPVPHLPSPRCQLRNCVRSVILAARCSIIGALLRLRLRHEIGFDPSALPRLDAGPCPALGAQIGFVLSFRPAARPAPALQPQNWVCSVIF